MAKRLISFSLRLLLLIVVADIIAAILILIPNPTINWIVDILLTITLWIFAWMDSVGYGQKDVKKDKLIKRKVEEEGYQPGGEEGRMFKPWFGFAAGLIAQAPGILLIIAIPIVGEAISAWLLPLLNLWNLSCLHIVQAISGGMTWVYLAPALLFAIVSGVAYLNGPNQQKRLETIIERNAAKKARRVQDDAKAKKKGRKK